MEKGHYEMSVAVAENSLLPALLERPEGSIVLADGFSCRTQIDQLAGLPTLTLAELLANHITNAPLALRRPRPATEQTTEGVPQCANSLTLPSGENMLAEWPGR